MIDFGLNPLHSCIGVSLCSLFTLTITDWMRYANMFSNIWNLFIVFGFNILHKPKFPNYTRLKIWKFGSICWLFVSWICTFGYMWMDSNRVRASSPTHTLYVGLYDCLPHSNITYRVLIISRCALYKHEKCNSIKWETLF
jgi:hypothetical protein